MVLAINGHSFTPSPSFKVRKQMMVGMSSIENGVTSVSRNFNRSYKRRRYLSSVNTFLCYSFSLLEEVNNPCFALTFLVLRKCLLRNEQLGLFVILRCLKLFKPIAQQRHRSPPSFGHSADIFRVRPSSYPLTH